MWTVLGVGVDVLHALAMAAWLLGFPLFFMGRWPRARVAYAAYAVGFVVASQLSMAVLGECFLTAITRWCWSHVPEETVSNAWFTERMAHVIFGLAPSRHVIARLSEAVVLATAAGVVVSIVRSRHFAELRAKG